MIFEGCEYLNAYRVILADPPWAFANFGQARHGAARDKYELMTVDEVAAMPVGDLGAANSVCLLWATAPVSAEGEHARVLRAWGYRPACKAFVWRKVYADGSPYCGLGFYTRSGGEDCWLGVRGGGLTPEDRGVYEFGDGVVAEHSAKPLVFHERIDRLWPEGRRLELFCRGEPRQGWDGWGNECVGGADVFGPEVGQCWPVERPGSDRLETLSLFEGA